MENLRKKLGNRIRIIRQKKNLSQEDLAHICNLHRTYVGGIERGERNPSLDNIEKIAKALEIEILELFKSDD